MVNENPYRALPSVDSILSDERVHALADGSASAVTEIVREAVELARISVSQGKRPPTEDQIVETVIGIARLAFQPSLRPVINATGVIIHTNLGRAPLSDDAIEAMAAVSRGYSNLEFDLEAGGRGSRFVHLESVLRRLTGTEAAIAVNNNASALLLALSALAQGGEVIISRGQAVEIGGGFRIPDVMLQSKARLVEVGTTNRTYLRDYDAAITENTIALMRVHASNFRVVGFTDSTTIVDLGTLARERDVLLLDDIGSGCLIETPQFGLAPEPTVQESLAAGADLVMFSGDKLLGGPQAGIIVGRADLIDKLRRHPLARAVRMDKASIAGLAATLLHYLRGEALDKVPVWQMISMSLAETEKRTKSIAREIGAPAKAVDGCSMIGGGSLPEEGLASKLVAIEGDGAYLTDLARRLRTGDTAVVGRIERDTLLLDPRTVRKAELKPLATIVKAALAAS
ncbi:MAG: L-seryl-tRNA(Sec) selenium transferase [Chloroflexi bacterium]|nr:L-seryl-tRNA(Sec) selenium transferase [Chloroflexota bacterium]